MEAHGRVGVRHIPGSEAMDFGCYAPQIMPPEMVCRLLGMIEGDGLVPGLATLEGRLAFLRLALQNAVEEGLDDKGKVWRLAGAGHIAVAAGECLERGVTAWAIWAGIGWDGWY